MVTDLLIVVQLPIEVGTIKIKAFDVPIVAHGNCQNGTKASEFSHGGECHEIIYPMSLRESLSNKSGFVLVNAAIGLAFDSVHPL